ncbi:hypothetical protein [Vreelandella sp. GE22]
MAIDPSWVRENPEEAAKQLDMLRITGSAALAAYRSIFGRSCYNPLDKQAFEKLEKALASAPGEFPVESSEPAALAQSPSIPKGATYARQAAMLCQDSAFQLYLDRRRRAKNGIDESALPDGTHNSDDARDWLVTACNIQSRAELDSNHQARQTFRTIRNRFNQWRVRSHS